MDRTLKNKKNALIVISQRIEQILLICCIFMAFLSSMPAQASLVVENSHASQRPGTEFWGGSRYVDISYDVSGTTYPLSVSVLISNDNGTTWDVEPTTGSLSGDIGAGVLPGTNKVIAWDAGADRPNVYWTKTKVRIIATEMFNSIVVSSTPTTGTWDIAGPAGFEGNGQTFEGGHVFQDAPEGGYTLTCSAIAGYATPSSETQTLIPGTWLMFDPVWTTGTVGQEITINLPGDVPMQLVSIPKGTFLMGSPGEEQDREMNEGPQHEVTLTNDFIMGKYSVTKSQWTAVMETSPWSGQENVSLEGDSPAVYISWDDINGPNGFVEKLNAHLTATDQLPASFRLPTEAEWEYACRANGTTRFYWGDDTSYTQINAHAWWSGNAFNIDEKYSHVVGQKTPNPWGLYDMSGNNYDWCQDWLGSYSPEKQIDPSGASSGEYRVLRGGSWFSISKHCRSALRGFQPTGSRYPAYGFRIVRTLQ